MSITRRSGWTTFARPSITVDNVSCSIQSGVDTSPKTTRPDKTTNRSRCGPKCLEIFGHNRSRSSCHKARPLASRHLPGFILINLRYNLKKPLKQLVIFPKVLELHPVISQTQPVHPYLAADSPCSLAHSNWIHGGKGRGRQIWAVTGLWLLLGSRKFGRKERGDEWGLLLLPKRMLLLMMMAFTCTQCWVIQLPWNQVGLHLAPSVKEAAAGGV